MGVVRKKLKWCIQKKIEDHLGFPDGASISFLRCQKSHLDFSVRV